MRKDFTWGHAPMFMCLSTFICVISLNFFCTVYVYSICYTLMSAAKFFIVSVSGAYKTRSRASVNERFGRTVITAKKILKYLLDFFFLSYEQMSKDKCLLTKRNQPNWVMLCLTALMEKVVSFIIIHNVFALKKSTKSLQIVELV